MNSLDNERSDKNKENSNSHVESEERILQEKGNYDTGKKKTKQQKNNKDRSHTKKSKDRKTDKENEETLHDQTVKKKKKEKLISPLPKVDPKYIQEAMNFNQKKMFEQALESVGKHLELIPSDPWGEIQKGIALTHLNRKEEAIESFDKATAFKSHASVAYVNKGICFQHFNLHQEAIKNFDQAIFLRPNARAFCLKGESLKALGEEKEALENFDKALEHNPCDRWAFFMKGEIYLSQKKLREAVQCFASTICVEDPESNQTGKNILKLIDNSNQSISFNARIFFFRGVALESLGRKEEAVESFDQALRERPTHVDALYHKGKNLLLQEKWQEAISRFGTDLALLTPFSSIYMKEITNFSKDILKSYKERFGPKMRLKNDVLPKDQDVIDSFQQTISSKPTGSVFIQKGDCFLKIGEFFKAIESFDCAIDQYNVAVAYSKKGLAQEKLGMKKEALKTYEAGLSAHPNHLSCYFYKANLLFDQGEKKDASDTLEKMIDLNPDFSVFKPSHNFNGERKFDLQFGNLRRKLVLEFERKEVEMYLSIFNKIYKEDFEETEMNDGNHNLPSLQLHGAEEHSKHVPVLAIPSSENEENKASSEKDPYALNFGPHSQEQQSHSYHGLFNSHNNLSSTEDYQKLPPSIENPETKSFAAIDHTSTAKEWDDTNPQNIQMFEVPEILE